MNDNDVDEQTRELSYPREMKILHLCELRRDAESKQSGHVRPRTSVVKLFVCRQSHFCQVKQFSFERNRQSSVTWREVIVFANYKSAGEMIHP